MQINNELLKSAILDLVYPVGSVFISFSSTNPQTYLGGTWTRLGDYFLLSTDTDSEIEDVGGSADAVVVSHTHDMQIGSYKITDANTAQAGSATTASGIQPSAYSGLNSYIQRVSTTGVSGVGKNMPPYKKVAMFRRTA